MLIGYQTFPCTPRCRQVHASVSLSASTTIGSTLCLPDYLYYHRVHAVAVPGNRDVCSTANAKLVVCEASVTATTNRSLLLHSSSIVRTHAALSSSSVVHSLLFCARLDSTSSRPLLGPHRRLPDHLHTVDSTTKVARASQSNSLRFAVALTLSLSLSLAVFGCLS
jgi:hypothetical protein